MRLWPASNREEVRPGNFFEYNHCHGVGGKFCSAPGDGGSGLERTPLQQADRILRKSDPRKESTARAVAAAMGPAFQQALDGMFNRAPDAHAYLEATLKVVAQDIGGVMAPYQGSWEGTGIKVSLGDIKGVARTVEKAVRDSRGDPTRVKDLVRATIVVDTLDQVAVARRSVAKHFDIIGDPKNRFVKPTSLEYRDVLTSFRAPNGLIGEIQIHVKPILKVKETVGHALYSQFRSGSGRALRKMESAMRSAYKSGWLQAVAATSLAAAAARTQGMK